MGKNESSSKEVQIIDDQESVPPVARKDSYASTETRRQRALILDAKLNEVIIDTYVYSAELVDEKLFKELINPETKEPFNTAREYFAHKSISLANAYRYARIGRELIPQLAAGNSEYSGAVTSIGVKKLEEIVRYASDQMDSLMGSGQIQLGDEVYSADDLKEITFDQFRNEIKKANKKVENYEVEVEKRKNAELERDQLAKEKREMEQRDAKYRDRSVTEDQIEQDLEAASKAFEKLQTCLTRIDPENLPERMEFNVVALIDLLPKAHENFSEKFFDVMMKHNDVV